MTCTKIAKIDCCVLTSGYHHYKDDKNMIACKNIARNICDFVTYDLTEVVC